MKIKVIAAVVAMVCSGSAMANDLIASVESGKGARGTAIGLDIVSDGTVAGFSFALEVPGVDAKNVVTKGCAKDLPSSFKAQCSFVNGKLMFIGASERPGATLAAGVVPVGSIVISGVQKAGPIKITGLEFSDDMGKSAPGTAKVDGEGELADSSAAQQK
jgi:hypothetical protein